MPYQTNRKTHVYAKCRYTNGSSLSYLGYVEKWLKIALKYIYIPVVKLDLFSLIRGSILKEPVNGLLPRLWLGIFKYPV